MEFSLYKIDRVISLGIELGAITVLIKTGQMRPYLKKSEAFKIYGRKKIEAWIEAGLLTPVKDGQHSAAYRLNRLEIEILLKSLELAEVL